MSGYPFTTPQLDGYRRHTDPAAEALVNRLFDHYRVQEIHRLFRHITAYEKHATAPGYLKDFVELPGILPDWIDPSKILRGREVFSDYGREIILALLCRSLPMCYICAHGAHVLATTTRLMDIPKSPDYSRRLLETLQFVINVSTTDILEPGSPGIIAIRKVRLIHATIRRFIHEKVQWDEKALGAPINQEDMLITMSGFGLEVIRALAKMGIHLSEEEKEAWSHLWFATGCLLGVEEQLIPNDYRAFEQMSECILTSQARRSDDGVRLSMSCVEFMSGLLPHRLLFPFSYATFRYLNDDPWREMMGFEGRHRFWDWFIPRMMRSTLGVDQKIQKRSRIGKFLIQRMNGWLIKGLSKKVMKDEKYFYLPDSLKP